MLQRSFMLLWALCRIKRLNKKVIATGKNKPIFTFKTASLKEGR